MKLEKLVNAICVMRGSFQLDDTDVLILSDVVETMKFKKPVTIMEIVELGTAASPATVHKRVKRLCEKGFLKKADHPESGRHKILEKGPRFGAFIDALSGV